MGKATEIAITVTQSVPIINGKKPNADLKGFHSVEVSMVNNEVVFKIGVDFQYKPTPMITTTEIERRVISKNALSAILSFKTRKFMLCFLKVKEKTDDYLAETLVNSF